ncbi:MAG: trypco2 family protein [Methylocella sp.]
MDDEPGIPLAQTIEDLRSELLKALKEGETQPLHFRLKPIELELQLAITTSSGGKGGVRFWVVELGANAEMKREATHKLKLVLEPVGLNGEPYEISSLSAPRPGVG